MAIVGFATEIAAAEAEEKEGGEITYRRTFMVITDNPKDGPVAILNAPLLPSAFSIYATTTEVDPLARVVSRTPRLKDPSKSRLVWLVEIEYSNMTELDQTSNPLAELPEVLLDWEIYEEVLAGEVVFTTGGSASDGSPDTTPQWKSGILNSAGEGYQPIPTRRSARPVISYRRNETNTSVAIASQFINSVNSVPWSGLAPRQAMCRGIRAQSKRFKASAEEFIYYEVEYTFIIKAETWDLQLLDYGPYYLAYDANGTKQNGRFSRKDFTDVGGTKRLGLLDHSNPQQPGKRLAEGEPAQFTRYRIYRENDFGQLGIYLNLSLGQQRRPRRVA